MIIHKLLFLATSLILLTAGPLLEGTALTPLRTTHESHGVIPNPTLTLSISLLSQRYCYGDGQVSTLVMKLRLHYTNTGKRPIILYKGCDITPSIKVSANENDASVRQFELSLSFTSVSSKRQELTKTQRLDDSFVVLQKGSSFDTTSEVAVPFTADDQAIPSGTVKAGAHVLQIEAITWPETVELAQRLGNRWKRRGYLWHEVVRSEPMPFRIEQQAKLENCY